MKLPIQAQSVMSSNTPKNPVKKGVTPSVIREFTLSRGFSGVSSCCEAGRQNDEARIAAEERARNITNTTGIPATVVDYSITNSSCRNGRRPFPSNARYCNGNVEVRARINIAI